MNEDDTLPIEDLDDFVRALVTWHDRQVESVQHLTQVPEGSVFQVGDDQEIVLTSEVLAGFKLGIELVMMQLGTLPFLVEVESEDEAEAEDAAV